MSRSWAGSADGTACSPTAGYRGSAPRRLGGSGGVPAAVLLAYQRASERTATTTPGCRLEWSVLAGIGRVESNNGRAGIGITADGTIRPPILGPVLDGSAGTAAISDSDGGRLDGDPVWDRTVGPMQFLPSSWVATRHPRRPGADGIAVITPAIPLTVGRHQVSATLEPTDDYAGRSATQITVDTTAGSVRGRELTFAAGGTGVINARGDGTNGRLDLTVPGLSLDAVHVTAMGISPDDSRVAIAVLDSTGRPLVVTVGTDSEGAQTVSVRSTEAVVVPSTAVAAGRIEVRRSE